MSPVGMPKGMAEDVVRHSFYKWMRQNQVDKKPAAEEVRKTSDVEEVVRKTQKSTLQDFSSAEGYNGAIYENYSWSQSIREVDINVKVPPEVTTKNLLVDIQPNKISVKIKHTNTTLLEGELCQKCKHTEAIWSLEKGKLEIHLEKVAEIWWDFLIQGEAKLDLTKIDCSRPYEELSEEAQAKIQELTWNQERKRLGLPTSEELQMQEKLKKAWNVEGSPFKGPFDPNAVIFQ